MKHRFLTAAIASIMLAGGVGVISTAIVPTQTVQAVSKHSWHWHWVHTTKDKSLYKLRFPLYRAPKFMGILDHGSDVEIRYFPNNHYYQLRDMGSGQWIIKGSSTNWFRNE